ncbi:leucine-rich repeat-containing protein 37A-like isoform X1 [Scyliorhinus canicula]|uniref:leucine-rich repeat-containing protein 37A-like isoform X1 n=1 Tax=Scyliorhinus canicula TaxID=7830 RepID=UPI0018F6C238|nr:leucine-rich repeat-containing protein 37A-like isoform X1 [Scyliorhinus canicula]
MAVAHVIVVLLLYRHLYIGLMQTATENTEFQNASCPILCTCTSWLLSCIGAGKWHQLDNVPFIRGSSYIFNTLELGENDITSIQESNWLPYRWTESLDLHGNQLDTLQKDSFEGLILVKKLNLSQNAITKIAGYTFQALPFLETLDLSENKVSMLLDGTFKSWHGLRFFRQLNLKSNPLEVIQNDAFDKLPSMQYLDLRGTKLSVQMMYPAFMAVPNIVQLDVPDAVRCCLCYVARTVEILFNTVKIQCTDPCSDNDSSCDVSETFLMINGTVLRSQMSLRNHRILESFLNQKAETNKKLARQSKLARSSKLGLLHQIEESEKNIYVGKHLDPRAAASKAARMSHLTRMRQRPSFARDNRFSSHLGRANHLQWNINGGRSSRHSPLNLFSSDKIPLHQLNHRPPEHLSHEPRLSTRSPTNEKLKKHKVIKRVRRGQIEDEIKNIQHDVWSTTSYTIKETTEETEVIKRFETSHPNIVELNMSAPETEYIYPTVLEDVPPDKIDILEEKNNPPKNIILPEAIIELGNTANNNYAKNLNADYIKSEQMPERRKALDPGHFSRTMQEAEIIDIGNNEAYKINVSDGSWHKPLGQFLDNAVQKKPEPSFQPGSVTQTVPRLSQLEIIKLLEDAYKNSIAENNKTQETNTGMVSNQRTTKLPAVEKIEGNKDLIPPVHPKKIIKESVKTSSSNNSKFKANVDDMFETKVNEEVRAVEPNKDIQTLFAHVIRIIKIDCLKPKLRAACTDLLTKIGHLMKQYEGKEYLPELGSWNPSLLRPDDKEEAGGKETDVFPPPIARPRPRPRPRPHKGHETGTYVPNYGEMVKTESSKKQMSLSAVEYGHKLLLAIAVTVVVMIIIAVVCLIEICSQRSESKTPHASGDPGCKKQSKSPLKKVTERITGKSSSKDAQKTPLLDEDTDLPKPLWLQDLYQPLDSVRKKSMGHGSHYKDSSDEEEVFSRANVRERSDARNP